MSLLRGVYLACAVIAVGADIILDGMGFSAQEARSGAAVRLSEPAE